MLSPQVLHMPDILLVFYMVTPCHTIESVELAF